MVRLCKDAGSSWSQFAWGNITDLIPPDFFCGLCSISEGLLVKLSPFYTNMLHSFAHVNNLVFQSVDVSDLPQNLWFGQVYNHIDWHWYWVGFLTVGDLPIVQGKIDLSEVTTRLCDIGCHTSPLLKCCSFQQMFGCFFDSKIPSSFLPSELVLL